MALIIKGKMPTRCSECRDMGFDIPNCPLHKHTQGNWYRIGKHPDCPIIGEIPDEHGRLVSEDEIVKRVEVLRESEHEFSENLAEHMHVDRSIDMLIEMIKKVPTIVEKSK